MEGVPQLMGFALVVDCPPEEMAELTRVWAEAVVGALPSSVWAELVSGRGRPPSRGRVGVPGGRYGTVQRISPGKRSRALTPASWAVAWEGVGTEFDEWMLHLDALTGEGQVYVDRPPGYGPPHPGGVWLWCARRPRVPSAVHFTINMAHWPPGERYAFADDQWLASALRAMVTARPADFAAVTCATTATGFAKASRVVPEHSYPRLGEQALGYEWVTVVPADLAQRMGGASALAASGAFWQVSELPGGCVWLQATERAADYGTAQIEAVFSVFQPFLPDVPLRKPVEPNPWVLYDRRGLAPDPAHLPRRSTAGGSR